MERVFRVFSVAVLIFCVILAVVVGSRLDQTTITLISGVALGFCIATPVSALVTFIAVRSRATGQRAKPPAWAAPMPHPYYVVQRPSPYGQIATHQQTAPQPSPTVQPFSLPPRRKFYLIGEDGTPSEIRPDDHTSEGGDQIGSHT